MGHVSAFYHQKNCRLSGRLVARLLERFPELGWSLAPTVVGALGGARDACLCGEACAHLGVLVAQKAALGAGAARLRAQLSTADYDEVVSVFDVDEERVAADSADMGDADDGRLGTDASDRDWEWTGACYFAFTVATTIGYGGYTPTPTAGPAFLIGSPVVPGPPCLGPLVSGFDRILPCLRMAWRRIALPNIA